MKVLKLKNISYRYESSDKNVLNNINIDFKKGKLYTIVGKSGSGKSTLLSIISGLDICTGGEILYKDKDLKNTNRDTYRAVDIGVIFQGYNLLINASAVENILLSMEISKDKKKNKKEIAYNLLERVGMDREKANRKVLKLSGGEQQRVGIARALSHNPDIIIADEPTGNLDEETERKIMDIFIGLAHKENKCIIIVTHSEKVSKYADEIWGLVNGDLSFMKSKISK